MQRRILFSLALCICICACAPLSKITSTTLKRDALPATAEVVVITEHMELPAYIGIQQLGSIKVGDSGFSVDCNYTTVLGHGQKLARQMGGNVLRITKHTPPSLMSTCSRIQADVYYTENLTLLNSELPQTPTSDPALAAENSAIIYFYRDGNGVGSLVGYDVSINGEKVWRASVGTKEWIKVKATGPAVVSAKTESKAELQVDLQPGGIYFIRCSIVSGVLVGRPLLERIENTIGFAEYQSIK